MTATTRRVLVGVLVAVSLLCAVGFACMVGSILHAGSQAVASGAETATFPSSTGWIATVLMLVGTWLGGSWAKWLTTAAKAVPVVTNVLEGIGNRASVPLPTIGGVPVTLPTIGGNPSEGNATPPVNSHETLLSALLKTLEITSGEHVHSEGKHSLGGGTIAWTVDFMPGHEATPNPAT